MGEHLICDTFTAHSDNGIQNIPDNCCELTEKELKKRELIYVDILDGADPDYPELDLHCFTCPQLNGFTFPEAKGTYDKSKIPKWTQNYHGDITMVVKILKFKFKWFGIQTLVEKLACQTYIPQAFLDTARAMIKWIPEWFGMSVEQAREYEVSLDQKSKELEFVDIDDKEKK